MRINRISASEKIFLSLFCTGALVFFSFFYNNHLYQKEQLQLFELTLKYFSDAVSRLGGISVYLTEFLIQFFRLPFIGAFIITSMLLLLHLLTKRILYKTSGFSPLILLSFLPAAGYWIILLDDFYNLSGLTGLLISLSAVIIYLNINGSLKRSLSGILLIPVIYWLTGAAYLVFVPTIITAEILFRLKKNRRHDLISIPVLAAYILFALILPFASRIFLFRDTVLQSFISSAYYRISIFFPAPLVLLFGFFPLCLILNNIIPASVSGKGSTLKDLLSLLVIIFFVIIGIHSKGNFNDENAMAYDNLVGSEHWDKIISKAEKENPSDRMSMIAVNLALAKSGELSSEMFRFGQDKNYLFGEYERRGMTSFLASETFYHLGLINFAQMFAMETIESTPDAKYPSRSFRRVAETYIINGQYKLALKYLTPLSHTLLYRKWAKECISQIQDEDKITSDTYWSQMRKLLPKFDFYYDPGKMDIALKYLLVSSKDNRMAYEYLMAYYLLQKDLDGFLENLPLAESLNYGELPLAWQEAAAYIETRIQQVPPSLVRYSLRNDVLQNIRSYAEEFSRSRQDTAKMIDKFGGTYWFYLHYR
jgi:hypothetical protein